MNTLLLKIFTTNVLLLLVVSVNAQQTKRVLFLGNSYTYYNDMPQIVVDAALSAGDTLIQSSNTPGGTTFADHTLNSTSQNLIDQGNWDVVVLQEQSQIPSFPIEQVEIECFPYAEELNAQILAENACTETMFYMTWGRQDGDAQNCDFWPPVCTYEGMDDLLRERYMMMGELNDAEVAPVGAVWRYLRTNHPDINLYASDGSHPSPEGSYAAAICFYTCLFRADPDNVTYNFTIDAVTAGTIRNVVHEMVYLMLEDWYVGSYSPQASVSVMPTGEYSFQFTNTSINADMVTITAEENVIPFTSNTIDYTFSAPGLYSVVVNAERCGEISTTYLEVQVGPVSIDRLQQPTITVYPNPASNILMVNKPVGQTTDVAIMDNTGRFVLNTRLSQETSIDISTLPTGQYLVRINGTSYQRIIII